MEMDWGTAIVGLISILICIVPFVIMYYNRVKKENKMLQSLNEIAQQHNCKIGQHEFCGDYVMGIDENRNFVFFFKQKKEEAISQFVDLSEIQNCQTVKKTRNVKKDIGSLGFIERVELSFTPTNKTKGEKRFELYDEEINMQLCGELQFVDKWTKQINDRLKNKK
jgi:ABC-type glycerol-3-phosphate transport system permease component